jgi:lipopolysaccharide transport system ATP-binding protein
MNSEKIAIQVEKIAKVYRIGLKDEIHDSMGGALVDFMKSPVKNYRKYRSLYTFDDVDMDANPSAASDVPGVIWALREVSFEVKQGEAIGIIGRNGAGKSTLLKILCRITNPTTGRAEIRGRVSSLLEVGTGFHPELTGRENVYLNATILGMKKKEVDRSFEEIVEFSGVEKFIDTPVKRYSSGMKVRLAFSVAAHLKPEVLLVDEVLAVGDVEFQKKCLGKMESVAREGRTVLFVSHNMGAITRLCERAICLDRGLITFDGPSVDAVAHHLSGEDEGLGTWSNAPTPGDAEVHVEAACVLTADEESTAVVEFHKKFHVEISYEIMQPVRNLCILFQLTDANGNILWTSWDTDTTNLGGHVREPGRYVSKCTVPESLVRPGHYSLSVGAMLKGTKAIAFHDHVLGFDISGVGYHLNPSRIGVITPLLEWKVEQRGKVEMEE